MTTNEYYNVVINPGDVPVLGINDAVQRPPPLPVTEPVQEQNRIQTMDINIRNVKIRNVYKFFHINMFILTLSYNILLMQDYITILDIILSFIECLYISENNENFIKVHTFYLVISFSFTASEKMYEFMGYYFIYSVINVFTFITLMLDRHVYFTEQLRLRIDQNVV